ncbi:MAG: nuclear transport factor 2 family protein [Fibrobacteria bacterium]
MAQTKKQIVDRFFECYSKHDRAGLGEVMAENVVWHFLGRHPYAGVKRGIDGVVAFFDSMAAIMADSKPTIEKPIVSENADYLIESVHTKTNRTDGINVDHNACVLWRFENGKIVEGRHFFADPEAVDRYFTAMAEKMNQVTVSAL